MGSFWRTLALCALIATMPFSGMRVICVGTPATESASRVHAEGASECERLCPLDDHASDEASDCALSAEGLSLIASAGVAVVRAQEPPQVPDVVRVVYTESPQFLPEPELPRFGPPPKSQAL